LDVVANSETLKKAMDVKDQMMVKFEKWLDSKVDTQKLMDMTKTAKKKFWNEFINEVLDEEFDYT
jgi:hypothetical protein